MQTNAWVLFALLFSAVPLAAKPANTPQPGIEVGQILNDTLGKTVRGWNHFQGSMYYKSETKDGVTTSKLDCCIAVFSQGRSYIVALTAPVERKANGAVIKEKVIAIKRLDARPGELQEECSLYNLNLGLTLRNPKNRMARSVVVDNGGFSVLEWRDSAGSCASDGL